MKQSFADVRIPCDLMVALAQCSSPIYGWCLIDHAARQHHIEKDAAMEPRGRSLAHTLMCPEHDVTVVADISRLIGACGVKEYTRPDLIANNLHASPKPASQHGQSCMIVAPVEIAQVTGDVRMKQTPAGV
jgi:hypothetical protein